MPLDLLVPDLLVPTAAPAGMRELRLPALEKWLARADLARDPATSAEQWLASAAGLPMPAPVASVALAGEGAVVPGEWLRADPVHLRIDGDGLVLHDTSTLGVTRAEADAILATLQAHFATDGLEFRAPSPDRWYVRVPEGELPVTTPLHEASGRNVFGLLPRGTGRLNWRSAITESQMLLTAHEANVRREGEGLPPINSVWFWGEGSTPAQLPRRYSAIYSADVFARGIARLSGVAPLPVPHAVGGVDLARAGDTVLVAIDELTAPLHQGSVEAWSAAAQSLDARWFDGLSEAIERFDRVRIVLPGEGGTRIASLDAAARRRWFRFRKPLATHV